MPMKVKEIIKLIKNDGWYEVNQEGSHRHFKHQIKTGKVTVPDHGNNDDIGHKLEKSILKQAGIKK